MATVSCPVVLLLGVGDAGLGADVGLCVDAEAAGLVGAETDGVGLSVSAVLIGGVAVCVVVLAHAVVSRTAVIAVVRRRMGPPVRRPVWQSRAVRELAVTGP
jgi:hypothetical protein